MARVRAGRYRARAELQRMASTIDAYGNTTGNWSALATRSAHILERLGKEEIQGGAISDVRSATMRVRADSITRGLTAADRVSSRGQIWAIRSIAQVDAQDNVLELLIERGVAS